MENMISIICILFILFMEVLLGYLAKKNGRSVLGFLVLGLVISPLFSIVILLLSGKKNSCSSQKKGLDQSKNAVNISFPDRYLVDTLDNVMKFINAFCETLPDEWCHLFISQEAEHLAGKTFGKIKFEIVLGNWWDNLLYGYPDEFNYIKNVFIFDPQKKSFIFSDINTGCFDGGLPSDEINVLLQKFLDGYEAKHPYVKFQRFNWGAQLTRGLK